MAKEETSGTQVRGATTGWWQELSGLGLLYYLVAFPALMLVCGYIAVAVSHAGGSSHETLMAILLKPMRTFLGPHDDSAWIAAATGFAYIYAWDALLILLSKASGVLVGLLAAAATTTSILVVEGGKGLWFYGLLAVLIVVFFHFGPQSTVRRYGWHALAGAWILYLL